VKVPRAQAPQSINLLKHNESKCVGLLIMFVKPLIEKLSFTLFGN
jgi:hypothetical protein